ncbi:hypothetical protein AWW67_14715 [Roseivirga seohaensis]|uniref:DUF4221 domain-containing protein n=1 Tax=Roseivirga seohaensis TaxID=1914963 RepID=A0A150Y3N2_9BACT|nr:hypothetical protein AWW67_14715 [Roseivirga seohaensis]
MYLVINRVRLITNSNKKYFLILFLLLFWACSTQKENVNGDALGKFELEKVGEKVFYLDSTLAPYNQSILTFEQDGTTKLSIFNHLNVSVNVFNYSTGQVEKQIGFLKDGPDGIGSLMNMGHFIQNSDSIFFFNHWQSRVHLMNAKGEKLRSYDVGIGNDSEEQSKQGFHMMVSPLSQAFKNGDRLFISVQNAGANPFDDQRLIYMIELNLRTGEREYHSLPQPLMLNNFWGVYTPFSSSLAFNPNTQEFSLSYTKNPEVDIISISNLDSIQESKSVKSEYMREMKPLPKRNDTPTLYGYSFKELGPLTNMEGFYMNYIYDPYKDVYYRVALHERTPEQYEKGKSGFRLSIIVVDSNFEKLDELELTEGLYEYQTSFVSREGLHLARQIDYQPDEDQLVFDVFGIKYKDYHQP